MEVSRCCLPRSVQCRTGGNPLGFGAKCVCVRVCTVFPVLSCIFLCCLLLDSPPLCFSSLNNTSVRCSPRTRASEEERETRGHRESVKARQRKGEEDVVVVGGGVVLKDF